MRRCNSTSEESPASLQAGHSRPMALRSSHEQSQRDWTVQLSGWGIVGSMCTSVTPSANPCKPRWPRSQVLEFGQAWLSEQPRYAGTLPYPTLTATTSCPVMMPGHLFPPEHPCNRGLAYLLLDVRTCACSDTNHWKASGRVKTMHTQRSCLVIRWVMTTIMMLVRINSQTHEPTYDCS